MLKESIILLVMAILLSLGINLFSPNQITVIGQYRSVSTGDDPVIPPDAIEGDPRFIDLAVAQMNHATGSAVFVDARDPEEFVCGTIPGSVNLPFEYLPEEDLESYVDSALGAIGRDYPLVVFCSGEECDLSLHMGRLFQDMNFSSIEIFFGGAREWEEAGLEMERIEQCGE
ncbi:MAG: rhodanese-like domain-containing protein [candidate division Zixibacteria bacterium]